MKKPNSAADFLSNMQQNAIEAASETSPTKKPQTRSKASIGSRNGLKHIGGYLDRDTVEKVAVLRARLELDNSELITLAINELYRKHKAKRAFNDE
jgi:hypothetical protein